MRYCRKHYDILLTQNIICNVLIYVSVLHNLRLLKFGSKHPARTLECLQSTLAFAAKGSEVL
jgi:hypothetical protein